MGLALRDAKIPVKSEKKKKRGIEDSQEDMSMIITFEVNTAANQIIH